MSILKRLRHFGVARGGLAALEFAILAPMMVFALFGAVDLMDALGVNRRAENASASLADVIARDTSVSNAEIAGLWSAVTMLMYPNSGSAMAERISCVSITSATSATVVWSEGNNGLAARTANSSVTLPSAMMQANTSIIMAETTYQYNSPLNFLFSGPITMSHTAYRRSRLIDPIPRVQ